MSAKTIKAAYKRIYDYEFAIENPDDRFSARRYSGLPSKHGETVPAFKLKSFETGAIAYIEGIRPDQIDKAADVIIDNLLTAKAAMRKTA